MTVNEWPIFEQSQSSKPDKLLQISEMNMINIRFFLAIVIPSCIIASGCASLPPIENPKYQKPMNVSLPEIPKDASEEEIIHQFIRNYDVSKEVIYERAHKWIAQNFNSAKSVIDYADKQAGTIVAKGMIPKVDFYYVKNGILKFTLTMDIKEKKARYDYRFEVLNEEMKEQESEYHYQETHNVAQKIFEGLTKNISDAIMKKDDF